jgi:hypothetical protein
LENENENERTLDYSSSEAFGLKTLELTHFIVTRRRIIGPSSRRQDRPRERFNIHQVYRR